MRSERHLEHIKGLTGLIRQLRSLLQVCMQRVIKSVIKAGYSGYHVSWGKQRTDVQIVRESPSPYPYNGSLPLQGRAPPPAASI